MLLHMYVQTLRQQSPSVSIQCSVLSTSNKGLSARRGHSADNNSQNCML
jgi:hypothetical protein